MQEVLKPLWKLVGTINIIDVNNDYLMVKFDHVKDQEKVANGGP